MAWGEEANSAAGSGCNRQRGATSAPGSHVWACFLHSAQALTQQEVPLGRWVEACRSLRERDERDRAAAGPGCVTPEWPAPGCSGLQASPRSTGERRCRLCSAPAVQGWPLCPSSSQAGEVERSRTLWQKGFWSFEPLHHTQETEAALLKATLEAGLRSTPNSVAGFCIDWLAESSSPFQPSG